MLMTKYGGKIYTKANMCTHCHGHTLLVIVYSLPQSMFINQKLQRKSLSSRMLRLLTKKVSTAGKLFLYITQHADSQHKLYISFSGVFYHFPSSRRAMTHVAGIVIFGA